jgi:hypothetical protein
MAALNSEYSAAVKVCQWVKPNVGICESDMLEVKTKMTFLFQ